MSQLSTNTLLVKLDWAKSCAVWLPWHLELEVHTTQCSRHLAQPDSPHRVGRFAASESPARRRPNPHRQLVRLAPPQLGSRHPARWRRRRLPPPQDPVDRKVSNSCQTSPRITTTHRTPELGCAYDCAAAEPLQRRTRKPELKRSNP